MDIISLGAATKAGMEENKTRKQTLELGVSGPHASVAKRLEALEASYLSGVKKANELIVKDTINIMKAHARLNAIAQSKKYKMENMIFDDLLDTSGLELSKSVNMIHSTSLGEISSSNEIDEYQFETKDEVVNTPIEKVLLDVETEIQPYKPSSVVSVGKPVKSISGNVTKANVLTDGIKNISTIDHYSSAAGACEVEIDLLEGHKIEWINMYFYYYDGRIFNDVKMKISADGVSWKTVFDSAIDGKYATTADGKKVLINEQNIRFIRVSGNGSDKNAGTYILEVEAFGSANSALGYQAGTAINIAKNKKVTGVIGNVKGLPFATDGNLANVTGASGWAGTTDGNGEGEIEIDLNGVYRIDQIKLFHYWEDSRSYHNVLVRISEDQINWTTVFDGKVAGAYVETKDGKSIDVNGKRARYVRCYTSGNTVNRYAHWSEVEVNKIVNNNTSSLYEISRDGGITWQGLDSGKLCRMNNEIAKSGNFIKLRGKISNNLKIKSFALTWA